MAEKGLIKQILLVSIGLFLLTQAGIDWEMLMTQEYWSHLKDSFMVVMQNIKDFIGSMLA